MNAPAKLDYHAQPIPVDDIFVVGNRRAVNDEAVNALVESIGAIGLNTPITVRIVEDVPDPETGEVLVSAYAIVAGRHRHEACRRLGWRDIPAIVRECDEIDAELIEIAENLHRVDLTKDQRDQQIRRYAELLEGAGKLQSPQNAPIESRRADGRGHRPQGVASKIAAATGLSKSMVNRALNPKPPTAKPKEQPPKRPDLIAAVRGLNVAWPWAAIEAVASVLTADERADLRHHLSDVCGKLQRLVELLVDGRAAAERDLSRRRDNQEPPPLDDSEAAIRDLTYGPGR